MSPLRAGKQIRVSTSQRVLEEKVAIVTGASRGIGAASARALAAAGAVVVLAARDEKELESVAREIATRGGVALSVPTDVTDPSAVEQLVRRTIASHGRLDVAVNNAGGSGHPPTPTADVSIEDFDATVALNLRGPFLSMKFEIPAMLESGGGAIVNMASSAGLEAVGGLAGYVSSKHALIGLTKTAALDYAERGIRVNAIAPGSILTDRLARAGAEAQRQAGHAMPMRRIGSPEEVADAVVWLCSEQASFVTGAVLSVDGGKLAGTPPLSAPR